jgi:hypothetical protein
MSSHSLLLGPVALQELERVTLMKSEICVSAHLQPSKKSHSRVCNIVLRFSMSSKVEHFIRIIGTSVVVEPLDEICESLPLRLFTLGIKFHISSINAIQEA